MLEQLVQHLPITALHTVRMLTFWPQIPRLYKINGCKQNLVPRYLMYGISVFPSCTQLRLCEQRDLFVCRHRNKSCNNNEIFTIIKILYLLVWMFAFWLNNTDHILIHNIVDPRHWDLWRRQIIHFQAGIHACGPATSASSISRLFFVSVINASYTPPDGIQTHAWCG